MLYQGPRFRSIGYMRRTRKLNTLNLRRRSSKQRQDGQKLSIPDAFVFLWNFSLIINVPYCQTKQFMGPGNNCKVAVISANYVAQVYSKQEKHKSLSMRKTTTTTTTVLVEYLFHLFSPSVNLHILEITCRAQSF